MLNIPLGYVEILKQMLSTQLIHVIINSCNAKHLHQQWSSAGHQKHKRCITQLLSVKNGGLSFTYCEIHIAMSLPLVKQLR